MNNLKICDELMNLAEKHRVDLDVMVKTYHSANFSCRDLKPESLTFSDELNITFRIIKDKKCVTMVTNNAESLPALMLKAIQMLPVIVADPFARIISANEIEDITTYCNEEIAFPSVELLKEKALATERHALKQKNVKNVGEASCSFVKKNVTLATSSGFKNSYTKNAFSLNIEVITEDKKDGGEMSSGYDYSISSSISDLKDPALLAESAVTRSSWGIGAKKIPSCTVPVIFEKRAANDILSSLIEAISGDLVSKQMSFLKNSLNKKICSNTISIVDDPLKNGSVYFTPFDGEGFATKKSLLIKDGILSNWLLDIHSAEKLHLKSTAHGHRSTGGMIRPGIYNMHLETTDNISKESMIEDVKNGLYVTETFSFGYNSTTGDYSKGISGFWIENGKIAYPVNEITIAGNLSDMLMEIVAANDISFDYQINSPTLFIPHMTVSGK